VKVYDIYEEDDFINIVMEICKEGELSKIIKERKINNKKVTTTETLDLIY
jgi:serine/threonine protein kinase